MSKCKVFVKILFNNKEVSRTPAKYVVLSVQLKFKNCPFLHIIINDVRSYSLFCQDVFLKKKHLTFTPIFHSNHHGVFINK